MPKSRKIVIKKRDSIARDSLTGILDPEVLRAYRRELELSRQECLLPYQDQLAAKIIDMTIKILDEWEERCACPARDLPVEERIKMLKQMKHTALCQACKRLHWVLLLWVDIEKLHLERLKMHYNIIKMSDKRCPDTPSATLVAADIINAYHAEREKEFGTQADSQLVQCGAIEVHSDAPDSEL